MGDYSPEDAVTPVVNFFNPMTIYHNTRRALLQAKSQAYSHLLSEDSIVSPPSVVTASQRPVRKDDTLRRAIRDVDMSTLYHAVRESVECMMMETFRKLLYPRLLLRQALIRQRADTRAARRIVPPLEPSLLQMSEVLGSWPHDVLRRLCATATLVAYGCDRHVFFEKEPLRGFAVVARGTCIVCRADGLSTRLSTGGILHEWFPLTSEPCSLAVKTSDGCCMWIISKADFVHCLALLPQTLQHDLREASRQRRLACIPQWYTLPFSDAAKCCSLLQSLSPSAFASLLEQMKPAAFQAGEVVVTPRQLPVALFLLRGSVSRARRGGEAVLNGPAVIGFRNVASRVRPQETLRAITDCDGYTLDVSALTAVLADRPAERRALDDTLVNLQRRELCNAQLRFRPLVAAIPIVKQIVPAEHVAALCALFEMRSVQPYESICSKTDNCDSVLVLTKGRVKIGHEDWWALGESCGFTCLEDHRWRYSAVAAQYSELLHLPRALYAAFLDDIGVLKVAIKVCRAILRPSMHRLGVEELSMRRKGLPALTTLERRRNRTHPHLLEEWRKKHRQVIEDAASDDPIGSIVAVVTADIRSMQTPAMYPITTAAADCGDEGFALRRVPSFLEQISTGGETTLTPRSMMRIVSEVDSEHRRSPPRRAVRVTPFLRVKVRNPVGY